MLILTCLTILFLVFNIYKGKSENKSIKISAIIIVIIKVIEIIITIFSIILYYLANKNLNSQISVNITDQMMNLVGVVIIIIFFINLILIIDKNQISHKNYSIIIFTIISIATLNVIAYISTTIYYFFQRLNFENLKSSEIYNEVLRNLNNNMIISFLRLIAISIFCLIIYQFLREIKNGINKDNEVKEKLV